MSLPENIWSKDDKCFQDGYLPVELYDKVVLEDSSDRSDLLSDEELMQCVERFFTSAEKGNEMFNFLAEQRREGNDQAYEVTKPLEDEIKLRATLMRSGIKREQLEDVQKGLKALILSGEKASDEQKQLAKRFTESLFIF